MIGGASAVIIIAILLISVIAIAVIVYIELKLSGQVDTQGHDSTAQGHGDDAQGHGDDAQGHGDDAQGHDDDDAQEHEYETVILDVCGEDIQLNNNVAYSCVTIPKNHLLPQNYL